MSAGYRGVSRSIPGDSVESIKTWVLEAAAAVNRHNIGKFNVTLDVTLTANAGTTTVTDARISADCALVLSPKTTNAAAAIGTTYVSSQTSGSAVLTHANNAQTDKTFRLAILG